MPDKNCLHCGNPVSRHPMTFTHKTFGRLTCSGDTADLPRSPGAELKVWPMYYEALESGVKSFEFRKDDREPRFEVGDGLCLREWRLWQADEYIDYPGEYTGRECFRRVTYVARGGVIPSGYCVMSVVPVAPPASDDDSCSAASDGCTEDCEVNEAGECKHACDVAPATSSETPHV
jgi:hypothetical protein